jgi:periplasmic divalent cation tolerance protein
VARDGFAVILITTSQDEESQLIARVLLEQKVAACVSIIPQVSSLFWWQKSIEQESESLLVVKTRIELVDEIIRLVKEVHSYDVPEIIAIPIIGGNPDYLEWVDGEVAPEDAR